MGLKIQREGLLVEFVPEGEGVSIQIDGIERASITVEEWIRFVTGCVRLKTADGMAPGSMADPISEAIESHRIAEKYRAARLAGLMYESSSAPALRCG